MKDISALSIKNRRRITTLVQTHALDPKKHIFTHITACTVGEFCVATVLLNNGKYKRKSMTSI